VRSLLQRHPADTLWHPTVEAIGILASNQVPYWDRWSPILPEAVRDDYDDDGKIARAAALFLGRSPAERRVRRCYRSPMRHFAIALLLAACARPAPPAAATPPASATAAPPAPTPAVPTRAPPPVVADLHVDTVTAMLELKTTWDDPRLEASLPGLEAGGTNLVVQAAWIPRGDPNPRGTALRKVHAIRQMVARSRGKAALVSGPDQADAVIRDGRIAVVIGLEGGAPLADPATFDELVDLGLAVIGPTWTEPSPFADSATEPRDPPGLTDAGRALIDRCNAVGLVLDISHMSDAAARETVGRSRAPVIASHSNLRAEFDHPRNLPPDLARAVADRGGLVAIMFHAPFLGGAGNRADAVRHLRRAVTELGAAHVGIGSDWDGKIKATDGLERAGLRGALRADLGAAGMAEEDVAQVDGAAFLAVWREIRAAAGP
jgi:membrane dipeptidase